MPGDLDSKPLPGPLRHLGLVFLLGMGWRQCLLRGAVASPRGLMMRAECLAPCAVCDQPLAHVGALAPAGPRRPTGHCRARPGEESLRAGAG